MKPQQVVTTETTNDNSHRPSSTVTPQTTASASDSFENSNPSTTTTATMPATQPILMKPPPPQEPASQEATTATINGNSHQPLAVLTSAPVSKPATIAPLNDTSQQPPPQLALDNDDKEIWHTNIFLRPNRKKFFSSSDASHGSRDRSSLPDGSSCRSITDPQVCCAANDSSEAYKDQYCVPSKPGYRFSSGSTCEPIGWVEINYNPNDVSAEVLSKEGFCDSLSSDRRFKLPPERPCSAMFTGRACCMASDIDGFPCVPVKGRFSRFTTGTRCEPSSFIARHQPENAGSCSVLFS